MKKIVVIPARSGSKGIPNKNIMKFAGRSLVSYALDSACESKLVDEIILTSDSEEILNFSKDYVNITPHKRTNSLSSDKSPVVDTIKELISLNGYNDYDIIILLQPTSPLRTGTHIDSAIDLFLKNKNAKSLISVIQLDDIHPSRMYNLDKSTNIMKSFSKDFSETRRQDIPPVFYRNGSIYISRVKTIKKFNSFMKDPVIGFIMSNKHWLNIDDERDLLIADSLINSWKNERK